MLLVRHSSAYKKSFKKLSKSGKFPREELESIITKIQNSEVLELKYQDHYLSGPLSDCRECHIKSDLLLVYKIENNNLVLLLVNLGSHSDLFD